MSCLAMERLKQMITRYSLQKSHLGRHSDSVKVTFVNLCSENISIHWVDYDGEEVEYFSVDEVRPEKRVFRSYDQSEESILPELGAGTEAV